MTDARRKIRLTARASRQIAAQTEYLALQLGDDLADRFYESVMQTIKQLAIMPGIGRVTDYGQHGKQTLLRVNVARPFDKWLIFYTATSELVQIKQILHGVQNLTRLLK